MREQPVMLKVSRPARAVFKIKLVYVFWASIVLAAGTVVMQGRTHVSLWRSAYQHGQDVRHALHFNVTAATTAWASSNWGIECGRLMLAMESGDYQGLHNVSRQHFAKGGGAGQAATAPAVPGISGSSMLYGGRTTLEYHLVLTSCYRPHWGRYLATTVMNIWLQGARPTTLTVLYCSPYNASQQMPSFFYNLRYSKRIRLLHVPSAQAGWQHIGPVSTYFWALMVPDYLQRPDLPLVVMEDDCVMAPQFGVLLASSVRRVSQMGPGLEAYMLNLYYPSADVGHASDRIALHGERVANTTTEALNGSRRHVRKPPPWYPYWYCRWRHGNEKCLQRMPVHVFSPAGAHPGAEQAGQRVEFRLYQGEAMDTAWGYGVQGVLFSPAMRHDLARHFWEVVTGRYEVNGFQDMILRQYVYTRAAALTGRAPTILRVTPSVLQHIGASSSVFGGVSTRFHMADDFPFQLKVPLFDDGEMW